MGMFFLPTSHTRREESKNVFTKVSEASLPFMQCFILADGNSSFVDNFMATDETTYLANVLLYNFVFSHLFFP